MVVVLVLLVFFMVILITKWYLHMLKFNRNFKFHGPPPLPVIGNSHKFYNPINFLSIIMEMVVKYGSVVKLVMGFETRLIIADHKLAEFILGSSSILEKSDTYLLLHPWLGTGLLTSSGEKWKRQRKLITPAFHFQILEQFIEVFNAKSTILVEKLSKEVGKASFNIVPYIGLCTLDVICEAAMGVSVNAQVDSESKYVKAVKEMCRIISERALHPIKIWKFLFAFTEDYNIVKKVINILHFYTNNVIKNRRKELYANENSLIVDRTSSDGVKKRLAFLDLLLQCNVERNLLTDENIREEVDTFMFEGHDTTSAGISFTLYCLARHPAVQQKVVAVLMLIFGEDKNRPPTYKDLQNMRYLEMVIKESMRKYPPVPAYSRKLEEDTEYDGGRLPKDLTCTIFAFGLHRREEFFPDPEKFDPERFSPENSIGRPPYAYLPFSAGPRNCIGEKWKRHRKLITPTFHLQVLVQFIEIFNAQSDILVEQLSKKVGKTSFDIFPYIGLCALDIICEAAMGVSVNAQKNSDSKYVKAVSEMCRIINARITHPIKMWKCLFLLTEDYNIEKKSRNILHSFTNYVIKKKREESRANENSLTVSEETSSDGIKKKLALLDLLLESKGNLLSDENIREEVDTIMFGGYDTITAAVSFTFYCLAAHPDVQQQVVEELKEIFAEEKNTPATYKDLQNMKYLEMVIKESMRKYPPAPVFGRKLQEDMEFDGGVLPKGLTCNIVAFGLHRLEEFFPDPEKFDPERFSPENLIGRPPYAYLPFSAGPRNCIGQRFAMLEMKATISKVLRNFEILPEPQHQPILQATLILKSTNGLLVRVKERHF